jgi:hypothetical protein
VQQPQGRAGVLIHDPPLQLITLVDRVTLGVGLVGDGEAHGVGSCILRWVAVDVPTAESTGTLRASITA